MKKTIIVLIALLALNIAFAQNWTNVDYESGDLASQDFSNAPPSVLFHSNAIFDRITG